MAAFIISLIAFASSVFTIIQFVKTVKAYNKLDESYLALMRDYNKLSAENSTAKTELLLKDAIIDAQQSHIRKLSKEIK